MTHINTTAAHRLLRDLQAFQDGADHARQEIEAAIEVVLLSYEYASPAANAVVRTVRAALADPTTALANHDQTIRAEHTHDIIDHLRNHPQVTIATNGSWADDKHADGGHG